MARDESAAIWEVVGGGEKGGLVVRSDEWMDSEAYEERLRTGSIVAQLELEGDRLHFELLTGVGPDMGWVSTKIKDKGKERALMVRYPKGRRLLGRCPLPLIKRSPRCPGGSCLTGGLKTIFGRYGLDKKRTPDVYVLMIPGAEDTVENGWLKMECEAPPYMEMATYEWPGHGWRKSEPLPKSIDELAQDCFRAFREAMCAGPFVICGHSIGVLIMTHVCRLAQDELGVVPLMAVSLDRGPPHLPVLTEYGHTMWAERPHEFMERWDPRDPALESYKIRVNDQGLDDEIIPVGFYKFPCPVKVLAAAYTFGESWPPPWPQERIDEFDKLLRNKGGLSPFSREDHEQWKKWAHNLEIEHLQMHHMDIKVAPRFVESLEAMLKSFLARNVKKPGVFVN